LRWGISGGQTKLAGGGANLFLVESRVPQRGKHFEFCGGLAALHLAVTAALTTREARRAAARVREDLAAAAALTELEDRNEELQKQVGRRGGGNHTAGACRDLLLVFVSPW
jgi:hypothetical protein